MANIAFSVSTVETGHAAAAHNLMRPFNFEAHNEDPIWYPPTLGQAPIKQATLLTKSISGHVYDANGVPVVGATVVLFRMADNYACKTTTSTAGGIYTFGRLAGDMNTYYTLAYSTAGGATQIHGTSDRGLTPA